jgi:hypothetical protein
MVRELDWDDGSTITDLEVHTTVLLQVVNS